MKHFLSNHCQFSPFFWRSPAIFCCRIPRSILPQNIPYFYMGAAHRTGRVCDCPLISLGNTKVRDKLSYSALFYAGAVLVLNILNLLTVKFAVLPVLYFPSLDRVFGVLVEDSTFLAKCLAYSARLLFFRLARRCGCRHADRHRHRLQQDLFLLGPAARPRARPDPVHRVDPASAHCFPDCGFRQCLP